MQELTAIGVSPAFPPLSLSLYPSFPLSSLPSSPQIFSTMRDTELTQSVLSNWFYYKMREELLDILTACAYEWLNLQR
jgi:hypothetical protein